MRINLAGLPIRKVHQRSHLIHQTFKKGQGAKGTVCVWSCVTHPLPGGREAEGVLGHWRGVMETSPHGFAPSHLSAAPNPSATNQKGFNLHFKAPLYPSSPHNPADLILPSSLPQLKYSPSNPPSISATPPHFSFIAGLTAAATSSHKAEQIK